MLFLVVLSSLGHCFGLFAAPWYPHHPDGPASRVLRRLCDLKDRLATHFVKVVQAETARHDGIRRWNHRIAGFSELEEWLGQEYRSNSVEKTACCGILSPVSPSNSVLEDSLANRGQTIVQVTALVVPPRKRSFGLGAAATRSLVPQGIRAIEGKTSGVQSPLAAFGP